MPSFKTPTPQQTSAAVQRMRSPEFAAYFFARLENPSWIDPLSREGLFTNPPPPIRVGDGVSFPHWPASKYLARMAKHDPSKVASILAGVETENAFVLGDIVDAALAMPVGIARELVPVVSKAAQAGNLFLDFEDTSKLCVQLAEGGELDAAMALAHALFAPRFEKGQDVPSGRDAYWYRVGLERVIPALSERRSEEFLRWMCDWLVASIDARRHVDRESGLDYSFMWRPAIEEHDENGDFEFAGTLVGLVRMGFELAIGSGAVALKEALGIMGIYQYLVFRRMRVHLVNECADQHPELARQIMMSRDMFDDHRFKHEYAMLVGRRLNLLTPEERDEWYSWVDAGPDMSGFDSEVRERQGREATDDDREKRKHYWQFEKLHWVRSQLDGDRRTFYEAMLVKHGEPELADLNIRTSSGWVGPNSPMTVEELAELTFEQVVERVCTWAPPPNQFMGPDVEGLASAFAEYSGREAETLSAKAGVLVGRPAIYVRSFIVQMAEAIKAGREIDISPVLALCQWVLEQPVDELPTPDDGQAELTDRDWQWTRDGISRLVQEVCVAKADTAPKYPLGLRERLWQLVSPLCCDRAESYIVHDISRDDHRLRDYLDLAINSPRGKAVEAALEYARWVANHVKQGERKHESVPGGLDAMPEVRSMLEWQIADGNRSFEAMAIIGSRMGLIYWIDKEWLARNAARVFQLDCIEASPPSPYGWAAWNAFLVWVGPRIEYCKLFKEQFAYAVAQSAQVTVLERTREQPMNRLGEHLLILYGRGQLGLEDDSGLLGRFLRDSDPNVRRHAIGVVGTILGGDGEIPKEILHRFQTLWEVYWSGIGRQDAEQDPDSWLFGTWFSCGRFPDQWALEQLEAFVEVNPTPEPDHAIVKRLAEIADVDITRATRILDRMVRGDREGWRVYGWRDSMRQVLQAAVAAGGKVRVQAEQVVDYLGRRGFAEFGELLESHDSAGKEPR